MTAPIPFKEATLTAANPSVDMINTRGSIEIAGTFDSGTVSQSLTGGATTIATFTVDSTVFTQANYLTFGITGGLGSESVTIRWYPDIINIDNAESNRLRRIS
jgi:hypothetical protein